MKGLDEATVDAVLADWRTAPVPDRLRATLGFLETLTLRPTEVTAATIRDLKAAGVHEAAIREAAYVCFLFNVLDRVADALDFTMPTDDEARTVGNITYRLGYGIAKLPAFNSRARRAGSGGTRRGAGARARSAGAS